METEFVGCAKKSERFLLKTGKEKNKNIDDDESGLERN